MNVSAAVLLAAVATPSMIHTLDDTADFAKIFCGLIVNIAFDEISTAVVYKKMRQNLAIEFFAIYTAKL